MAVNRVKPQMSAASYKTYEVRAPRSSHFRRATCAEMDCPHHLGGWKTTVDERTDLGKAQAHYIRKESGRRSTEHRDEHGMTVFTFEAGQECFQSQNHYTRLERDEIFLVRDGDWRGNPRGTGARRHNADTWLDDFANHQDALAEVQKRG